jgi:hypothetical protein
VLPFDLADVVNPADVGMGNLEGCLDFVEETVEAYLITLHSRRQELQGHRLAELEVVGTIYLAHASAAEQADNAISLGEYGAGDEPGLVWCGVRSRGRLAL